MATTLRVLVVDDNADSATTLCDLATAWGHSVKVAKSGAEALRVAEDFRPKVVLLDLGLPDQHGYDVAVALRKQARERSVHFVAVTGWGQIADQIRSAAGGITHHIVKPANTVVLREILAAYAASELNNAEKLNPV